jgi:hypothetical protein
MTNIIKITPDMAQEFNSKYDSSQEPIFCISENKEITHGCRVIEKTQKAVFVYVRSFRDCFGFWMTIEAYKSLKNGFIKSKNVKLNYNNSIYQF